MQSLMPEPNPELKAVLKRFLESIAARDFDTSAAILSGSETMRYIGSDDAESWSGTDVRRVFAAHMDQLPAFTFEIDLDSLEAFSEGRVGWGTARIVAQFEGQDEVVLRHTAVYVLEEGFWHAVQIHNSIGLRNEEVAGVALTNTLDELLRSLELDPQGNLEEASSRGTMTLLFTDIEASTSTAASVGDRRWSEIISWHDQIIRDHAEQHGGVVIKALGDGALLSFGSAHAAAKASIGIQRAISGPDALEEISIRIGIHSGDVVMTEGDVLGNTVNVAARVASAARGGEIVVSSVVYGMLADSPAFEFGATRQVELKGIERVHEVTQLVWFEG